MQVCEEVGKGLVALHERSIVHRDLKPHNVLFTEGMRTKLSDMGLCKRLTTDQTSYDSAGPGNFCRSAVYDNRHVSQSEMSGCICSTSSLEELLFVC